MPLFGPFGDLAGKERGTIINVLGFISSSSWLERPGSKKPASDQSPVLLCESDCCHAHNQFSGITNLNR